MAIFKKHEHELLNQFLANEISFVIVGGAAVELYGCKRTHNDLDLLISQNMDNLSRLENVDLAWLTFKAKHIQALSLNGATMQDRERGLDILTGMSGIDSSTALSTFTKIEADGLSLPVIAKNLLIKNKKAVGALKDLEDIESLSRLS